MARSLGLDAWLDGTAGEEVLMKPPPELREWIVGDDDPATAEPIL